MLVRLEKGKCGRGKGNERCQTIKRGDKLLLFAMFKYKEIIYFFLLESTDANNSGGQPGIIKTVK